MGLERVTGDWTGLKSGDLYFLVVLIKKVSSVTYHHIYAFIVKLFKGGIFSFLAKFYISHN